MSSAKAFSHAQALLFALAALSLTAGPCLAKPRDSTAMPTTGPAAATPLGYIAFCARHPDQCVFTAPAVAVAVVASAPVAPAPAPEAAAGPPPPVVEPSEGAIYADPDFLDFGDAAFADPSLRFLIDRAEDATVEPPAAPPPQEAAPPPPPVLVLTADAWRTLEAVDRDVNTRIRPATDVQAFGQDNYWDLPLEAGKSLGNCKHYALEKRRALAAAGVPDAAMTLAIVRTARDEVHAVLVVSTDHGDYLLDNLSPWVEPWSRPNYRWMMRQAPGQPFHWFAMEPRPQAG